VLTKNGTLRERLIKISQYMEQRIEDFDIIKEGIQSAGAFLSDVHLTVQTNQRITEARAAQNQAELRSVLEGLKDKVGNHFSYAEKEEQST
jgi:ribonuclease HI